jgi:predicted secreted protein
MKTSAIIAAFALLLGTAAIAQQQPQAAEAAPPAERQICRTERVGGSLTRVNRVCATRAEWDRLSATSKKIIDDVSRAAGTAGNANSNSNPAPGPGNNGM